MEWLLIGLVGPVVIARVNEFVNEFNEVNEFVGEDQEAGVSGVRFVDVKLILPVLHVFLNVCEFYHLIALF